MTDIVVDIRNVTSQVHPDDRVYVWAPHLRERTGGGMVSTAPQGIPLVDGQVTIKDVEPGPLMIRFECMGISDTGDKQGVVPEDKESVGVFDVLADSLIYPAPVVGAAQSAAQRAAESEREAQAAAERSQAYATGRVLVEDPPGSGLYVWHPVIFEESPPGSGLYLYLD